jgi:hypothetical protein
MERADGQASAAETAGESLGADRLAGDHDESAVSRRAVGGRGLGVEGTCEVVPFLRQPERQQPADRQVSIAQSSML